MEKENNEFNLEKFKNLIIIILLIGFVLSQIDNYKMRYWDKKNYELLLELDSLLNDIGPSYHTDTF